MGSATFSFSLYGETASLTSPSGKQTKPVYSPFETFEDINGAFPDKIHIKTRTQSFNSYHYYLVHEGLIWYKAIEGQKGPEEWTLFDKTGLPHNKRKRGFIKAEHISEISADADELVALSADGRFYRYCFDWIFSRTNKTWHDVQGWPSERQLLFDERTSHNIAWALGKRNAHTMYYEDIFGNQHHYGTMEIATTYLLLDDGQEIVFGDTGLPSDFSRNILGPDRGRFIACGLSASASTIFLIGEGGEMFTRLADFDTLGCDPMFFKYTYIPYKSEFSGTEYRSNYSPWGLPSENWYAQSPIPLSGKAAITRRICILQNGKGNAARELRVAGLNDDAETGYWSKPIFGKQWHFVPAPLDLREDDFIDNDKIAAREKPRGNSLDRSFKGYLWKDRIAVPDWEFEIPDFNILEGSCSIKINYRGEKIRLLLHPVEVWTYMQRKQPGRDGTPKNFFVTIEVPDNAFADASPAFRKKFEPILRREDRQLFRFIMEAGKDYLMIESRSKSQHGYTLFLTADGNARLLPSVHRMTTIDELSEFERFHSQALKFDEAKTFTKKDYAQIKQKINANKLLRREINNRIADYNRSIKTAQRSKNVYSAFSVLTHATLLYRIDFPKIYTLTRFGNSILETQTETVQLVSGTRIWLDQKLLELLELRIKAYSGIQNALASGAASAKLPPYYAENFSGYWGVAGLPLTIDGIFQTEHSPSYRGRLSADPLTREFPGWTLEIGERGEFVFLVELENAAKTIFEQKGEFSSDKPWQFNGKIHLTSAGNGEDDRYIYESYIKNFVPQEGLAVRIQWDGKKLEILPQRQIPALPAVPIQIQLPMISYPVYFSGELSR